MALISFGDLKDAVRPTLWELEEMKRVQLAEGTTLDRVLQDVQAAMTEVNNELLSMLHYSQLFAVQDTVELEYPIGVVNGIEEATEYSVPTPKRGKTTGHSLPIKKYDRGLGWTRMYLKDARSTKIDADVSSAVQDIQQDWQQKLLQRLFKMEAEAVGASAGYSLPLADGGVTDATYVPPTSPSGKTFLSSHDHFLRHAAINDANVLLTVAHLQEHGFLSPYDVIASETDQATWIGLTGFKKPEWPEIVYHASATERAPIPDVTEYIGYIETQTAILRVWLTPRVPSNYYGMYKKFGPGDPRNPVRVRINETDGFGWNIVPGNWINDPLSLVVLYAEHGLGIGENRINGVCVYINASGDYVTPTIS